MVGSIPTSVWTGKYFFKLDIRDHGSGNAGATNVFRVLGWKAGVFTALVDMAKGAFAALVISQIKYDALPEFMTAWEIGTFLALLAAAMAVVGHMFPLYAKFKGGKGVATASGGLIALAPFAVLLAALTFAIVLISTRYVSLSSLLAAAIFPVSLAVRKYYLGSETVSTSLVVFGVLLSAGIIWAHRSNISRLLKGNENRVKSFKPSLGSINQEEV